MDERVMQFRVGVTILAALLITAILVMLFQGAVPTPGGKYDIHILVEEAPGVSRDTPVRKNGILIGRVTNVQFVPRGSIETITNQADMRAAVGAQAPHGTEVLLTASIERKWPVYHNEICRIRPGVFGDSSLEFVLAPKAAAAAGRPDARQVEANDPPLTGEVLQDPMRMATDLEGGLAKLLNDEALPKTNRDIQTLVNRVNQLLSDDRVAQTQKVMDELPGMIKKLNKLLDDADLIVGDVEMRGQLKSLMTETPKTVAEARQTLTDVRHAVTDFQGILSDVKGMTGAISGNSAGLIQSIGGATNEFQRAATEIRKLAEDINNPKSELGQGTVGLLLHDSELYDRLNRILCHVDELTRKLEPVVDDARVFSDKIARHPETLGVRGAIQKNPGIK